MLTFSKQKLYIEGRNIFYYDKRNFIEEIRQFSNSLHEELKEYLGIQREIRLREKLSQSITNDQKRFDEIKIHRVNMFYDYYVDQILQMTQMQYFENFKYIEELDLEDFLQEHIKLKQTSLKLQHCFDKALKICEDIKLMVEKQIKQEYPIETFSDKYCKK